MSSKVMKDLKTEEHRFELRHFSDVEKGESEYELRPFADEEELSIQDLRSAAGDDEPATIETKEDEITDRDYLPPSKLAKAEDGLIGERVSMPRPARGGSGFIESEEFIDIQEHGEEYPKKVIRNASGEIIEGAEGIDEESELKKRIRELENQKKELEDNLADKIIALETKTKEAEDLSTSLPQKLEEARTAGFSEGESSAKAKYDRQYEASKTDYLKMVEDFNKESLIKLLEISNVLTGVDDQIAYIVIGFVKSIIGEERKINDIFAVKLIKENLSRLNELKEVSFSVNPSDHDLVKSAFPDYVVATDTSIKKGAVKVTTKLGEISLDPDKMIEDLSKQISATLAADKEHK